MLAFVKPRDSSPPGVRTAQLDSVTRWAEEFLATAAPTTSTLFTVSVCEVSCAEPGCAPIETVISLLADLAHASRKDLDRPAPPPDLCRSYSGKVFKPLLEVVREDVTGLIARLFSGTAVAEHLAGVAAAAAAPPPSPPPSPPSAAGWEDRNANKEKKSLIDLWAEDGATHGEGLCLCCAPIQ